MRAKRLLAAVPAVLLSMSAPSLAQSDPAQGGLNRGSVLTVESFVDSQLIPAERDLRPAIILALTESDPRQVIAKIDALAPLLPDQSTLRLFLLLQRASTRVSVGQVDAGRAEFEALIQRFPQVAEFRMFSIDSLAYGSAADVAARQWIDLANTNPDAARSLSGYILGALTGNLAAKNDTDSKIDLFLALDRIGYDPGSADLRNQMQLAIFARSTEDSNRSNQAVATLRKLTDPDVLLSIATQSRYRDYWGYVELDAASLNKQGADFLRELERDFLAAKNGTAAGNFLRTAAAFGDAQAVATQYSRLLARVSSQSGDNAYVQQATPFWVAPIAFAWATAGAPENAEEQFKTALKQYAGLPGTTDLNISANYAALLLDLDRPREALTLIEPAIAKLVAVDQSAGALAEMHSVRLRAYNLLGEAATAGDSRRYLEETRTALLQTYTQAMLMIGEDDKAKDAIIAGLRSSDPEQAIQILQFPLSRPSSAVEAEYEGKRERLRLDPDVLAALEQVGRIVPVFPIDAGPFDHAATADSFPLLQ